MLFPNPASQRSLDNNLTSFSHQQLGLALLPTLRRPPSGSKHLPHKTQHPRAINKRIKHPHQFGVLGQGQLVHILVLVRLGDTGHGRGAVAVEVDHRLELGLVNHSVDELGVVSREEREGLGLEGGVPFCVFVALGRERGRMEVGGEVGGGEGLDGLGVTVVMSLYPGFGCGDDLLAEGG